MNDDKPKARILVVDDDAQVADLVVDFLNRIGYDAAAAYGGSDGLDWFREEPFQMVITDMRIPAMDGVALLEAVKAIRKDVIVILITAYSTINAAVDAIKLGAFDSSRSSSIWRRSGRSSTGPSSSSGLTGCRSFSGI